MLHQQITPADQPSVEDRIRAVRAQQEAERQQTAVEFERQTRIDAERLFNRQPLGRWL